MITFFFLPVYGSMNDVFFSCIIFVWNHEIDAKSVVMQAS